MLKRRFTTVFVGAVAKIEQYFGELWGEHLELEEEDMTPEQLKWYKKFLDARELIFDQGNHELHQCMSDSEMYDMEYMRQETRFLKEEK